MKLHVYLKKSCWPRSGSWWLVCRLYCAAFDCQGGDSGQITAGEVGGRGRWNIWAGPARFSRTENLSSSYKFLVFKLSVLRKAGKIIREVRPFRESEKGSELGVVTRQLRCLFVLSVRLYVIAAASPGGWEGVSARWCGLTFPHLSVDLLLFRQLGDVRFLHFSLIFRIQHRISNQQQQVSVIYLFICMLIVWFSIVYLFICLFIYLLHLLVYLFIYYVFFFIFSGGFIVFYLCSRQ